MCGRTLPDNSPPADLCLVCQQEQEYQAGLESDRRRAARSATSDEGFGSNVAPQVVGDTTEHRDGNLEDEDGHITVEEVCVTKMWPEEQLDGRKRTCDQSQPHIQH